jgi:hypothetical protein
MSDLHFDEKTIRPILGVVGMDTTQKYILYYRILLAALEDSLLESPVIN